MRKIKGMVQLKTGDAVKGIVSRRWPWFNFLKLESAEVIEAKSGQRSPVDGHLWVPKTNVLFIQELVALDI